MSIHLDNFFTELNSNIEFVESIKKWMEGEHCGVDSDEVTETDVHIQRLVSIQLEGIAMIIELPEPEADQKLTGPLSKLFEHKGWRTNLCLRDFLILMQEVYPDPDEIPDGEDWAPLQSSSHEAYNNLLNQAIKAGFYKFRELEFPEHAITRIYNI